MKPKHKSLYSMKTALLTASALFLCAVSQSQGATLINDGVWNQFQWFSGALPISLPLNSLTDPYTFTVPSGFQGLIDVTDYSLPGDQFAVLDNGSTNLGFTTSVTARNDINTLDQDIAFANSEWSSGSFLVPAGNHSLTFQLTAANQTVNLGSGWVRLTTSPIPEPQSTLLLAISVLCLGLRRRRS